jgi:hypothetical protein
MSLFSPPKMTNSSFRDAGARLTGIALRIKKALAIRSRTLSFANWCWGRLVSNRFGVGTAQDLTVDLRFGGYCGGIVESRFPQSDAVRTQSMHYWQLERLFDCVPVREDDVLVDVGCGKGRVINFWLHSKLNNPIVGVDLNPEVAAWTRERLRKYPSVTIADGNILDHIQPEHSLFFLYNPFGEQTLRAFSLAVKEKTRKSPTPRVLYYNSVHRRVFDDDPDWIVCELTCHSLEATILATLRV